MSRPRMLVLLSCFVVLLAGCPQPAPADPAGEAPEASVHPESPLLLGTETERGHLMATRQFIRPAGDTVAFSGRPVDIVAAPDGKHVYAKDNEGIVVVDAASWRVVQKLTFSGVTDAHGVDLPEGQGGSMHGLALGPKGKRLYATTAQNRLYVADVKDNGTLAWTGTVLLPGKDGSGNSHPAGIAVSEDGTTAYVCVSMNNTLAVVDLDKRAKVDELPVGVAPYDVALSPDGKVAYVSDWGGRRADDDDLTATSAGTEVVVDERGVASTGFVSFVDLEAKRETAMIQVDLHPTDLVLSPDGTILYVANANSDTVSVIDTRKAARVASFSTRPDAALPFGSMPNALALSPDGKTLYVANGGNNAVAVVRLPEDPAGAYDVAGFIPAAWWPGGVAVHGERLFVANVKGWGSRYPKEDPTEKGWHVYWAQGVLQRVEVPGGETLAAYTAQVREDAMVPQVLRAHERGASDAEPEPVPDKLGEPSVFEHVVYIIKENRTYDQVFGKMGKGNGDPSLCIFPREVTPNHHAIADEFVLLDNWYCNGVNSADGHAWSTEGNVTDYLEQSFGGFTRSYAWGDDALSYSSTGFFWDNVLAAGLSFRNYGEFDYAEPVPEDATFKQIYDDWKSGKNEVDFTQNIGIDRVRQYSAPDFPGWNMRIPDVLRADAFIKELKEFEKKGHWPNFMVVYLPQDHNSGTSPGMPTPRAHMADNDLALGRIVEAVSKSRFWKKTCIFVIEDDPQDGFDHVDGHRSVCLVASPYTKRGAVVSTFYNQTSVLHTMARILGLPPLNQMDALAPLMTDVFTGEPDFTPYEARDANIPLDELNPELSALEGEALHWAKRSLEQDFEHLDATDEDTHNRILWFAAKGPDVPYPAEYAGAHGKGLADLGLVRDERFLDDDD